MLKAKLLCHVVIGLSLALPIKAQSADINAKEMNDFFTRLYLASYCDYINMEERRFTISEFREGAKENFGQKLAEELEQGAKERANFIVKTMNETDFSCAFIADRLAGFVRFVKERYANDNVE